MQNTAFTPEVITALATLRDVARRNRSVTRVVDAINTLDNAGVFAALDEQTDYADAESILAEAACTAAARARTQDEAEWGDTTTADMAAHQAETDRRMSSELDAADRRAEGRLGRRALGLESPHSPGCPSIKHRH